jgi:methylated-DNA-[protein]-cysteine S-methyltransferase
MKVKGKAMAFMDIESPVGRITLAASEKGLTHLQFGRSKRLPARSGPEDPLAHRHLEAAARALKEYFARQRTSFDDLQLAPEGTAFQRRVWQTLRKIPYGKTESYGSIAKKIGKPKAARAVGLANNRNPIGIIVPCHRVIGASGDLTGYGGGLEAKEWLLEHEGAIAPRNRGR